MTSPRFARVLLAGLIAALPGAAFGQDLEAARLASETGRYAQARGLFEKAVEDFPASDEARLGLAGILATQGLYEEALEVLGPAEGLDRVLLHSRILRTLGRDREAIRDLRLLFEESPTSVVAARELASALRAGGEPADDLDWAIIEAYNRRSQLNARELLAVGDACRALGDQDPDLFKDALRAYDEAIAANPSALEPRVAVAELFLEKYDSTQARDEARAVLEVHPKHLGGLLAMARIQRFDGGPEALQIVRAVLEINPRHVEALVLEAELQLELEDYETALERARQALEVNPGSLDALAAQAAAAYLMDDPELFALSEAKVQDLNRSYADFYNLLADACVRNRFYREAAEFARKGIAADPRSWRAHGLLGLNLLRLGRIEEGRASLEAAFAGDPYNVWIKNTLDLVDTFDDLEEYSSDHFSFVARPHEAALLAPEALRLAEEAWEQFVDRYEVVPPSPIRLEFFDADADFSVRTIGLAGMGALGVCFGEVIAQDSPTARPRGTFNWGSTLWHEIAHSFTLALSEHRVPRWLTEGLSVLEERRARQGWGEDVNPRFLSAWKRGDLLPIGRINEGFVRPKSAEQVGLSYIHSSYLAEMIEREWGFSALRAMLLAYADGASTEEVFEAGTGLSSEELDARFQIEMEERFGALALALGETGVEEGVPDAEPRVAVAETEAGPEGREGGENEPESESEHGEVTVIGAPTVSRPPDLEDLQLAAEESPEDFRAQMAYGEALVREERPTEAIAILEHARSLFPPYVGQGDPYRTLARLYLEAGEEEKAADRLTEFVAIDENAFDERVELARLRRSLGDPLAALTALEETIYIFPNVPEPHRERSELYAQLDDLEGLVRARRALVAVETVDRAGAHFRLAEALYRTGDLRDARRQLLSALEIAPAYSPALELLLRVHEESKSDTVAVPPTGGGGGRE